MNRFIILDRDGVINYDSLNYIKGVDEFKIIPTSAKAIARLTAAGFCIGVATNQSGISRGLYTEAVLQSINQKMIQEVEAVGGRIDAIEYCPHMPESGCPCRKPMPGMLHALSRRFHCSLKDVPFVGDRVSDIQAALAAGAKPVMILSPMTDQEALKAYPDVLVYESLAHYVDELLMSL